MMNAANIKEKQERAVCQVFLDWYNQKHGTAHENKGRPEDIHPELNENGRRLWEFVCSEPENDEWIAVEIKSLVNSDALKKLSYPINIVNRVEKECASKLTGVYWLNLPPLPPMDQRKQQEVVDCMCNLLIEQEGQLEKNDPVNICPKVEQLLGWKLWPNDSSPTEICLTKEREDSNCLVLKSFAGWTGAEITYTDQILKSIEEDANHQLAEAKDKGARKTCLVFDCQFSLCKSFEAGILDVPQEIRSSIDEIYFVQLTVDQPIVIKA